jgi:hypothetical protein
LSAALTGISLVILVTAVNAHLGWLVIAGFLILGSGWGGMIPLQEVTWASYFGRRHIGAVRSAGLPFSILLGAGAPLLVSAYYDWRGDYNGALLVIAGSCFVSAVAILFLTKPSAPGGGVRSSAH